MLRQRQNRDAIIKFKKFGNLYDRIFILISGSLWIISSLWDIYKLQRYRLDYTAELYGCFFIFYMMAFSINPKLLPVKIYNSFSLITTIKGRGTILLIISTLFLNDKHTFHQFCAVLLFAGGILYFIFEILVPTTKQELEEIEAIYKNNNNINKINKDVEINNISNISKNDNNQNITILEKSNVILNNIQNEIDLKKDLNKEINKENSTNNMIEEEKKSEELINNEGTKNNKELINNEGAENNKDNKDKKDILVEEEIVRKTDNPYEIPEDF